jgi:hypothetical protein
MGTGNLLLVRRLNIDPQPLLVRLRRFAEAELGLGFTIILAAASMSSQPPAVDVPQKVSLQVIAGRMHPELPRLTSPSVSQLTPPSSIETAVRENEFQANGGSDATDRAWSEYNHHWAGLIVLVAGLLASGLSPSPDYRFSFCSVPTLRTGPWARVLSGPVSLLQTFCSIAPPPCSSCASQHSSVPSRRAYYAHDGLRSFSP